MRTHRIVGILASFALIVGSSLVSSVPTAEAATKHKVSISAPKAITQYSYITIKGKVKPAVGKVVVIQKKNSGAAWKKIATVSMRSDGSYSYRYQVTTTKTRQYRAYAPKSGKVKAAYSKAIKVTVRAAQRASSSVSITATGPTSLTAGEYYQVSGTTSANLKGKTVHLQIASGSTWSNLAAVKVTSQATFSLAARALEAGAGKHLRVYAPQTSTTKASVSTTRGFTVYGWYYLSELDAVEGSVDFHGGATINGGYYEKSVGHTFASRQGPYSGQYDLGRKCTTFAATIGWRDDSPAGSVATASIYADSLRAWSRSGIAFGTAVPVSVDISSALRLTLESQRSSASGQWAYFAYGNARIRCAF